MVPGDPKPVESTPPDQVEEDVADIDGATQDDINEDIEEGGGGEEPEEPDTLNARVLTAPDIYEADFDGGVFFPNAGSRGLVGSTPETDQIVAFARENGRLVDYGRRLQPARLLGHRGRHRAVPSRTLRTDSRRSAL